MNILFCTEGFIIDGVASYNLYLSAALKQAGHEVSVVGRWIGKKGFQERHKRFGVDVIQCPSPTVENRWLVRQAEKRGPDIIITDSRRAFPLSQRIKERTEAKVVTVFHDPPQHDREGERSLEAIMTGSDAWVTAERPILEELQAIRPGFPVCFFQRPITGVIEKSPLPPKDPFRVLCLGRLSRWKSPGFKNLIERAVELKEEIPSLEMTFVGGGGQFLSFWHRAKRENRRFGKAFVRVVGPQRDPQPWIKESTIVCAGATSAVEAILSNRPVLAFSGFWIGLITEDNLDYSVSTHFGERQGTYLVRDRPEMVPEGLKDVYHEWHDERMGLQVDGLGKRLAVDFDSQTVARQFYALFEQL
ncbi:MAG: glycosyltransferase family 4 protein [Desulfatiglans sp.]|jgi:glycosyltransferase involved in cell wall biosynthesis|nr:glycosyltransferase family 4 protein [Thermodesulfobacteriota bacterium]MEE4351503.1 glycosyltransferase family 4 protein [Desulfatiglans sp.]